MRGHVYRIIMNILKRLSTLLPDKVIINYLYRSRYGKKPDLKNPKTFNEKIQWLKLYNRDPLYTSMADKYEARKYVSEKVGEKHVVPLLGVWDSFDEIDFDALPDKFVLKCNHDSGSFVICTDKNKLDKKSAKTRLETALKRNYYTPYREWAYKNINKKIIAEKHIGYVDIDYRLFMFDGELRFIECFLDGVTNRRVNLYLPDWTYLHVQHEYPIDPDNQVTPPHNFDEMIELAKALSKDIPFLRVDLWNIDGHVYLNELTFYPNSGVGVFTPGEWDEKIGSWLTLPNKRR